MSEQLIDSYIDRAAIEKETAFLVSKLEEVHDVFLKIKSFKVSLQGANSFTQIADAIGKIKVQEVEFLRLQEQVNQSYARKQKALDEVQKAELALIKTYEKRQANTSDIAKDLAEEKLLLAEQAKQMKDNAKEALGMVSAYEKLQKQFMDAAKEAKDIGAIFGTNSQKYKDAAAKAAELNDKLKAIDGGIGNFQRNVGNYAGSLSPALESVKKELEQIRTQLKQTGLSANEIDKLNQKAELLSKVLIGVDVATKSTKQELRNFTEAAKQIGLEFGIASREFQTFIKGVGNKKDELGDIQAAINFQASDTKYIDGVVEAVSGLAGAYGAAEGAAVIFGDAGKDVQETMAKLQASIAIVTGLQQVLKTIQLEGAAAQTFLAAKTSLLDVAESVNAKTKTILGISTQAAAIATAEEAIAAETASIALSEQAIAGEAASVASGSVATTATGASIALGAEATAAGVAEAASISFATAFIATGIGAIIVALAAAVALVVVKMNDYQKESKSIESANKELENGLTNLVSAVKAYDEIRTASAKREIDDLTKLNEQRKAAGITAEKSLALDIAADKKRKELSDKEVARAGATKENVDKAAKKAKESADYVIFLEQEKQKFLEKTSKEGDKDYEDKLKAIEDGIKAHKSQAESDKAIYDYGNTIYRESVEIDNSIAVKQAQAKKLSADEQRKLTLETTKIEAGLVIDKNSRILSSEKSTQEQRLAAIKSNSAELKRIAIAENAAIQNDPTQSNEAKTIAQKSLNAQLQKISKDSQESILKTNEDFRRRDIASQQGVTKIVSDLIIKSNEEIANSDSFSYQERIAAFNKLQQAKIAQIDAEYTAQKELQDINGANKGERELLEKDHEAKITATIAEGTARQIDIQLNSLELVTNKIESEYSRRTNIIDIANAAQQASASSTYSKEIIDLNNKLQRGEISLSNYNNTRKKLDDNYNTQTLIDTQKRIEADLRATKEANEKALADKQKYQDELNKLNAKPILTTVEVNEKAKLQQKIADYKDYTKQISELEKNLNDNKAKLSDEEIAKKKEAQAEITANYQAAAAEVIEIFKQLIEASYQRELDAIQEQTNAIDIKKAKDIEVANQTILNEQDKAARIRIIEAKAQSEKDQLEQKKRKIQLEQARFEKAYNIGKIIADTAAAVIKTLAVAGPFSLPLAVSIGILGAAQLAKVIATPLPKYKDGVESHPGGYAIVGDGGKQEVVFEPTGKTYLTPATPTIMDLPIGTKVLPSVEDMTRVALLAATPSLKKFDGETMNNYELIQSMSKIDKRLVSVEKAIRNKKETHFNVTRWGLLAMQQEDQNQWNYLNENLRF